MLTLGHGENRLEHHLRNKNIISQLVCFTCLHYYHQMMVSLEWSLFSFKDCIKPVIQVLASTVVSGRYITRGTTLVHRIQNIPLQPTRRATLHLWHPKLLRTHQCSFRFQSHHHAPSPSSRYHNHPCQVWIFTSWECQKLVTLTIFVPVSLRVSLRDLRCNIM